MGRKKARWDTGVLLSSPERGYGHNAGQFTTPDTSSSLRSGSRKCKD